MESIGNTRYIQSSSYRSGEWTALDKWARRSNGQSGENRLEAANRIRTFANAPRGNLLDLSNLALTKMPPLPNEVRNRVQKLSLNFNNIRRFKNMDFPQLDTLEIVGNRSEHISGILPKLLSLSADNSRLTSFIDMNCPLLRELYLTESESGIESISGFPHLGILKLSNSRVGQINGRDMPDLELLDISDARIGSLSGMFPKLISLRTEGCDLGRIDWQQFPNLYVLGVSKEDPDYVNGLAEHCPRLKMLGVPSDWIGHGAEILPEGLRRRQEAGLEICDFNSLDDRLNDSLDGSDQDSGPEGILINEVANWCGAGNASGWKAIQSETNAEKFAGFLRQLNDTEEARSSRTSSNFQHRVQRFLAALENQPELRANIFTMAAGERRNCVDRRTITFADLEMEVFTHNMEQDAARGGDGMSLVAQLHQLHRHELLNEFAKRYVNERMKADDQDIDVLDVHLAFRYRMAKILDLPIKIGAMKWESAAEITSRDFERASTEVMQQDADDEEFASFIAANKAWSSFLKNANKREFEKLAEAHLGKDGDPGSQEFDANLYAVAEHELKLKLTREWLEQNPGHAAVQSNLGKRPTMESHPSPDALRNSLIGETGTSPAPWNTAIRNAPARVSRGMGEPALQDNRSGLVPVRPAMPSYFAGIAGFGSQPDAYAGMLSSGARQAHLIGQMQRPATAGTPRQEPAAALGFPGGSDHADVLPGMDPAAASRWLREKLNACPNGIVIQLNPADLIIPDDYYQAEVLNIDETIGLGTANPEDNIISLRALGQQGDPPRDVSITLAQLLKAWCQEEGYDAIQNRRR